MSQVLKLETGYTPREPEPAPVDPEFEEMKEIARRADGYVVHITQWTYDVGRLLKYVAADRIGES